MAHNDSAPEEKDDRLEFNDGVGDMLRPREKEGFGWLSTVLIIVLSLLVIVISFWISFNVGKKIFLKETPEPKVDTQMWEPLPESEEGATDLPTEPTPAETSQAAEELTAPAPVAPKPVEAPKPAPVAPKPVAPAPAAPKPVAPAPAVSAPKPAPAPAPKPVVAAPKPVAPVAVSSKPNKILLRVIAGSFGDLASAQRYSQELTAKGLTGFVFAQTIGAKTLYRVQVGAFSYTERAEAMVQKVKSLGYDAYIMQ